MSVPSDYDEAPSEFTWLSLLRAVRAPLAVLLIAAVGLLVPPQTADMVAALGDGRLGDVNFTVTFQLSLARFCRSAPGIGLVRCSQRISMSATILCRVIRYLRSEHRPAAGFRRLRRLGGPSLIGSV
jgi:hypothetical protein